MTDRDRRVRVVGLDGRPFVPKPKRARPRKPPPDPPPPPTDQERAQHLLLAAHRFTHPDNPVNVAALAVSTRESLVSELRAALFVLTDRQSITSAGAP